MTVGSASFKGFGSRYRSETKRRTTPESHGVAVIRSFPRCFGFAQEQSQYAETPILPPHIQLL